MMEKARRQAGRGSKGFTLIELLIVVAIIAILALIAVPNFLEAQVRSKISRAYADMRVIGVALEAYAVDRNSYPPGFTNLRQGIRPDLHPKERNPYAMSKLTTPVAYLTSMLIDPFSGAGSTWDREFDWNTGPLPYWYEDWQPHPVFGGWVYPGAETIWKYGYTWTVASMGPVCNAGRLRFALEGRPVGQAPAGVDYFAYDPTNGTVSRGIIARTNKGHFKEVNQK